MSTGLNHGAFIFQCGAVCRDLICWPLVFMALKFDAKQVEVFGIKGQQTLGAYGLAVALTADLNRKVFCTMAILLLLSNSGVEMAVRANDIVIRLLDAFINIERNFYCAEIVMGACFLCDDLSIASHSKCGAIYMKNKV